MKKKKKLLENYSIIIKKESILKHNSTIKNNDDIIYFFFKNQMDLDLKDFEWERKEQNLEGGFYNIDNKDFFISLNKENLAKVLNGEELESELYRRGEGIDLREMEEWVKKELILCLLTDSERRKNLTEALPIGNKKESEKVTIKISERLLNELLIYEGNFFAEDFEYRYDTGGNKIHFYVSDSHGRETLKDNIDFYKKIWNLKYKKKKDN